MQIAKFDLGTSDLGRSPNLWNQSRWDEMEADSNIGFKIWEDFLGVGLGGTMNFMGNNTNWFGTQYNSTGALVSAGLERGVVGVDSVGATSDDGFQIQLGNQTTTKYGLFTPAAGSTIFYEVRVALGDTPTTAQCIIGLSDADIAVLTGGVNYSEDFIGFETLGTVATVKFYIEKAAVRSTLTGSAAACHTWIEAGTATPLTAPATGSWVKLGFRVNGVSSVDIFVDGVEQTSLQMAADCATCLPVVPLSPVLAVATETSTDPVLSLDWIACSKLYSE